MMDARFGEKTSRRSRARAPPRVTGSRDEETGKTTNVKTAAERRVCACVASSANVCVSFTLLCLL